MIMFKQDKPISTNCVFHSNISMENLISCCQNWKLYHCENPCLQRNPGITLFEKNWSQGLGFFFSFLRSSDCIAGCLKIVFRTCWTMTIPLTLLLISLWRIWSDNHFLVLSFQWKQITAVAIVCYFAVRLSIIAYRVLLLVNAQPAKFRSIFQLLHTNSFWQVKHNLSYSV